MYGSWFMVRGSWFMVHGSYSKGSPRVVADKHGISIVLTVLGECGARPGVVAGIRHGYQHWPRRRVGAAPSRIRKLEFVFCFWVNFVRSLTSGQRRPQRH